MNSSVWVVWAAKGSEEFFFEYFWPTFEAVFSTFHCQKKIFLAVKSWKKHPQKLLRKTQIYFFFFLLPWAAQTTQTEEFMFQNVAYRPTG